MGSQGGFNWVGDKLDYPMFIATTAARDQRGGCLVGFATQCSVHPLRFVVFISKKNSTYRLAERAEALAVHVVPTWGRELAELFGGETSDEVDKFARCRWRPGLQGVPILVDCKSWFAGTVVDRYDAGDHVGFVLEPQEGEAEDPSALGFQDLQDIEPGHEP